MNLRSIGGALFFLGVASALLNLFGYELKLLMWIDIWGVEAGWGIRAALTVIGGALWMLAKAPQPAVEPPSAQG